LILSHGIKQKNQNKKPFNLKYSLFIILYLYTFYMNDGIENELVQVRTKTTKMIITLVWDLPFKGFNI
jgi:hypothetical protein